MHLLIIENWVEGTGRLLPAALVAAGHEYTFVTRRREHYGVAGDAHPIVANARAVLVTETNDVERLIARLLMEHQRAPFDGVLTVCDYYVETVVRVAAGLQLPHPFSSSASIERRKDLVRKCLDRAGLPNPDYRVAHGWAEVRRAAEKIGYPVVVKPTDLASSAFVRLVDDEQDLESAYGDLERFPRNYRDQERSSAVLVEEYLAGPEFSVEACTVDGSTTVFGITDKSVTPPPCFVETGHMFPADLPAAAAENVAAFALAVLRAVGHDRGVSHTEVKLTEAGPRLIEVNPRLPGNYIVELIRHVTGIDLLEVTVALACGLDPVLQPATGGAASAAVAFLIPPNGGVLRELRGLDSLDGDPFVARHRFVVEPGATVPAPTDNGSYLGHLIALDTEGRNARRYAEAAVQRLVAVVGDPEAVAE